MTGDSFPNNLKIDLTVIVNHPVTQACHLSKWKTFKSRNRFRCEPSGRFANYKKTAQYSILCFRIPKEIFLVITRNVLLNSFSRVQNIQKIRRLSNFHTLRGRIQESSAAGSRYRFFQPTSA